MRNLKQHPITKEEIIECLLNQAEEISSVKAVGDIRPTLLKAAAKIVEQTDFDIFESTENK